MRGSKRSQRGWAWLSWAVPAAAKALGVLSGSDEARRNRNMQMDAMTQGIRWKVADAKAAGIHPLYALGASTSMPSPVYAGVQAGLEGMGQDLGRAFMANESQGERNDRLGDFMREAEARSDARVANRMLLEENIAGARQRNIGAQLDNELKRLQLFRLQNEVTTPAFPSGGKVDPYGAIQVKPSEQVSANPALPGQEAAPTPGFKSFRFGTGSMDLPGQQLSESLEGMGVLGHILAPYLVGRHWLEQGWQGSKYQRALQDRGALGPPRKGYRWALQPDGTWKEVRLK